VVISQLDDEDVLYQAILALARLGGDKAEQALTTLTEDKRQKVRTVAKRALARLKAREAKRAQAAANPPEPPAAPKKKPKKHWWQR
jgi:HEAT repeat protein